MPKNYLSFSLFGKKLNSRYTFGIIDNLLLSKQLYPGWVFRVYHDNSVHPVVLEQLKDNGAELIEMPRSVKRSGTYWRFLIAQEPDAAVWICRDADSRVSLREVAAVNEWLASPYNFHVMRDNGSHYKKQMLAGMWGGRKPLTLVPLLASWNIEKMSNHGDNDRFLCVRVWPMIKHDCMEHDSRSTITHTETLKSFTVKYPGGFIGAVVQSPVTDKDPAPVSPAAPVDMDSTVVPPALIPVPK